MISCPAIKICLLRKIQIYADMLKTGINKGYYLLYFTGTFSLCCDQSVPFQIPK